MCFFFCLMCGHKLIIFFSHIQNTRKFDFFPLSFMFILYRKFIIVITQPRDQLKSIPSQIYRLYAETFLTKKNPIHSIFWNQNPKMFFFSQIHWFLFYRFERLFVFFSFYVIYRFDHNCGGLWIKRLKSFIEKINLWDNSRFIDRIWNNWNNKFQHRNENAPNVFTVYCCLLYVKKKIKF